MNTSGFHHVTMVSADAARTVAFYRDLLGLALVKRTVNFDDPSAHHLYFGLDGGRPGSLLTFFEWKDLQSGAFGIGGVHHVALSVPDADAQLKWKRRLVDAGVHVTGPYDRGYFRSIYFSDPDDQILEIATAGPGYAFDESADALGQEVITPSTERLRGHRDERAVRALTHGEPVPVVTPDMSITGIHHVSGITDDVARAGELYGGALGLSVVKKTVNQDDGVTPHWFWAGYDGATVTPASSMTLFEWNAGRAARPGTGQTHHIAFRAADEAHQAELRGRLTELGFAPTQVIDRVYFQSIYFEASDGQLCEVATDGPGFAVDEDVASLGSRLCLPPWLEAERVAIEGRLTPLPEPSVVSSPGAEA